MEYKDEYRFMIPKAEILTQARNHNLLPGTVQKDYVISWLLRSISKHSLLSRWVFKGGTCLKKCYFGTYRFSEDLDFTVPHEESISVEMIKVSLEDIVSLIEEESGIIFPRKDWKIEGYTNPQENISYQAKISYQGPLKEPPNSLPRIKFDITQDEIIVDTPQKKHLCHDFSDKLEISPKILCYSIEEILAEKTRALVQRKGRARDVYDVVSITQRLENEIDIAKVQNIIEEKFKFKNMNMPSIETIMDNIDAQTLKANWDNQLAHQIANLPPVNKYLDDLKKSINHWLA